MAQCKIQNANIKMHNLTKGKFDFLIFILQWSEASILPFGKYQYFDCAQY